MSDTFSKLVYNNDDTKNEKEKNKNMTSQILYIGGLIMILFILYYYFSNKNNKNEAWLNDIEPDIDTVFLSRY